MQEKSENFTASDQYFLSYVKKLQGGGQIDPPPIGIGLNKTTSEIHLRNILNFVIFVNFK